MDKAFIENTLNQFNIDKQLNDNFLQLMYEYYKVSLPESKYYVKGFGDFKKMLYLWLNTPVTTGNRPEDLIRNMRPQTMNKGVKNTIIYFKNQLNKTENG